MISAGIWVAFFQECQQSSCGQDHNFVNATTAEIPIHFYIYNDRGGEAAAAQGVWRCVRPEGDCDTFSRSDRL